jgi:hypothetical protein
MYLFGCPEICFWLMFSYIVIFICILHSRIGFIMSRLGSLFTLIGLLLEIFFLFSLFLILLNRNRICFREL